MKKHLRNLLAAALLLSLCLGPLSGCRPGSPEPVSTVRIGVTVYDQYDTFISEMISSFVAQAQAAEEETGLTITILRASADNSQQAQNNQVESFIEAGCDVLCVNLVDRTDVSVIIDKAEAAGIPVIFFNRELVGEDLQRNDRLFYVGADALESGRMQGQIVVDFYQRNPDRVDKNGDGALQYVMLEGEATHQDAIVRTEYSVAEVVAAGIGMERLEDEIANWTRSQAETRMSQWLETHGDAIEVVLANNDDMALGAIDALKRAGVPHSSWPLVVGIDGTSVGLEAVLVGEMTGTVYNDARGQAQGVLDLALALAAGSPLPPLEDGKYIRLPYHIITAENVLEFNGLG